MIKFIKLLKGKLPASIYLLTILVVLAPSAMALSQSDINSIYKDTVWYDTSVNNLCGQGGSPSTANSQPGTAYFVGDSLTVGMKAGGLESKMQAAGWKVAQVEATGGISVDGSIPKVQSKTDQANIADSTVAVVELGTNPPGSNVSASSNSFVPKIQSMVGALKAANSKIQIYWMNAYADNDHGAYSGINQAIAGQAASLGYTVIDWHSEAQNNNSKYTPFGGVPGPPLVHPNKHYDALADFVVNSLVSHGSAASGSKTIVLDPGHSDPAKSVIDPATGLIDYDYPNTPEIDDVFAVAQIVKTKLAQDGYNVLMTKSQARQYISLRQRADIANNAKADLAVSIHDQAGSVAIGGLPFANSNNNVYIQQVGLHRDKADGTQVKFTDQAVADLSAKYGQIFAAERTKAEGHSVTITQANINRGPKFSPGNIWEVQLWSNGPWIYNEAGGNSVGQIGLNQADKQKYAQGLINGIEKAVPPSGPSSSSGSQAVCSGVGDACLGIALPTISDPNKVASAINQEIKNIGTDKSYIAGLGQYFVEGASRYGINPLLLAAIAGAEESFANPANIPPNFVAAHNTFGNLISLGNPVPYASWILSMDNPAGGDESEHLKKDYLDNPDVVDLLTFASLYVVGDAHHPDPVAGLGDPRAYAAKLEKFIMDMVALADGGIQCGGSGSSSSIVQTALNLAWPEPPDVATPPRNPLLPKPEYTIALAQFNPNAPAGGADCGAFVGTVMRASGADPNYPTSGTVQQQAYVTDKTKSGGKYQIIQAGPNDSLSILQSGDILIVNQGQSGGVNGHTLIFIGNAGGKYNSASASINSQGGPGRMPNLDTFSSLNDGSRGYYLIARLIH